MTNKSFHSARSLISLSAILGTLLLGFSFWSIRQMQAAQQRLEVATRELGESQRKVVEMQRFKVKPTIASLAQETPSGMSKRIDDALLKAGLGNEDITSSNPQDATQHGTTNYKQRLTEIKLNGISMKQIIEFCKHLEDPSEGLTVRDLIFHANRTTKSSDELWDVTLTLTQLIFSPTS